MKFPDFIEQLILSKPYSQLTAEEKNSLSEYISSEDEYNTVQAFIANMQTALANETPIQPALDAKAKLMATFAQTHKTKSGFGVIHGKRLLVGISVAASLAIAVGAVWVFMDREKTPDTIAVVDSKKETPQSQGPNKQKTLLPPKPTTKTRTIAEEKPIEPIEAVFADTVKEEIIRPFEEVEEPKSISLAVYTDLPTMTVTIF